VTRAAKFVGHGLLPAPAYRRGGDFIFVSSIHPLTADGVLPRPGGASPWVGESIVGVQTRTVLDNLDAVLREAGSGLDRVVRVEVQLADATDFPEFKHAYAEVFPVDPPARTTIVVGDEHLVDGARLNLHAVALAADSPYRPETVTCDGVPDPLDAEHAALAVKAGPFVFCSGLPATDYRTGLAVTTQAGAYHGSDAALQAKYVIDNLEKVLIAAGSSLDSGLKVHFYQPDLRTFPIVDREWGERVGVPPTRSSMSCRGLLVPGAMWIANLLALVPGRGLEKRETRQGIAWHPVDAGKANFSPGIRAGQWLFTAGQVPVPDIGKHEWVGAPRGLPNHWSDIELQTDYTMSLLGDQLQANGFGLEDIVDARIYLARPRRDFRGFARAWNRVFDGASNRPAMSIIPSTQADGSDGLMIQGPTIEIDLTATVTMTAEAVPR